MYDVTPWLTNNCNTHVAQNLTQLDNEIWPIEYNMSSFFVEKSYTKCSGETIPRPFSKKSKLSISLD